MEKHRGSEAARSVEAPAKTEAGAPVQLFRTLVNSNGVLIGLYRGSHGCLDLLAVNPNFLKKELKDAIFLDLREWYMSHSGGKLSLAPNLISGAWKNFLNSQVLSLNQTARWWSGLSFKK